MFNVNKFEQNFGHLIYNKLLKQSLNFVEKYYFSAELLIVEYQRQNIVIVNMVLHK